MKCAKCEKEITSIVTNKFAYDGSDYDTTLGIEEDENYNAVIMETDKSWTGYELAEEEMRERMQCPYCKQFPFGSDEIQIFDVVRIVCFKSEQPTPKEIEEEEVFFNAQ
ncbi:MAG: hypothetical protein U0L88_04035 [Acutalibacteraceae bacterium]|nr:hypothetical protein [Acutalibacteraceae bacterium]